MRLPLAAAALLVLAGCISPAATETGSLNAIDREAVAQTLQSLLADLPCEATAVDGGTSDNLRDVVTLAYDGSAHGEIDIRGDWLLAARYQAGGFEVVNVADPTAPKLASVFEEATSAQDVKWMPDNRTAVLGFERTVLLVDVGPVLDSTLPPERTLESGVVPEILFAWEYPSGLDNGVFVNMHMLSTARIDGKDYVFLAPNSDTGVWLLEARDGELVYVTNFGAPLGGSALGPHDMSLVWDEFLQKPVLYVANGFEGWIAWDVSAPETPARLGVMVNLDPGAVSYTHTILGAKVGERRLVVTIGEVGVNMMKVYDATSFATPILLGVWWADRTNPVLPQHNIQIVDGLLYMAHYGEGIYVFDLNSVGAIPLADTATLAPIAHYAAAEPERATPEGLWLDGIWDVTVHRGLVYANDMMLGTSIVGFGCLAPGDDAATSWN